MEHFLLYILEFVNVATVQCKILIGEFLASLMNFASSLLKFSSCLYASLICCVNFFMPLKCGAVQCYFV